MSGRISKERVVMAEELQRSGELCFQGFLKKRSRGSTLTGKFMKSWRERQVMLYKSRMLVYYSEQGSLSQKLRGVFDLNNASVSRVANKKKIQDYEDSGSVHIFRIVSAGGEKLILAADADWRMEKWIEQLEAVIQGVWVPNKVMIRNSATGGKLTEPEVLTKLLDYASSNVCADCSAQNPTWASINIGVLVCTACSGVHRSLGVHISFIQSIKMDYWTEEGATNLIENSGGPNSALNEIFEYHVPHGRKYVKPHAHSPRDVREKFIRNKYADRLFGKADPGDTSLLRIRLQSEVDTAHNVGDFEAPEGPDISDDDHEVEEELLQQKEGVGAGAGAGSDASSDSDSDEEYHSLSMSSRKEDGHGNHQDQDQTQTQIGEKEYIGVLLVNPLELRLPWAGPPKGGKRGMESVTGIFKKVNSALQNGGKLIKKKWFMEARTGLQVVVNHEHAQTKIKLVDASDGSSGGGGGGGSGGGSGGSGGGGGGDDEGGTEGLRIAYKGAPLMLSWDGVTSLELSAVEQEVGKGRGTRVISSPSSSHPSATVAAAAAAGDGRGGTASRTVSTVYVNVTEYLARLEGGETVILDLALPPPESGGKALESPGSSSRSTSMGLALLTLSFTRLA